MKERLPDEPNMSDATLLLKLEDLINMAMGPSDKNIVNYKMIQTVLHILARHMRMLETHVEIRIGEISSKKVKDGIGDSDSSESSPRSPKTRQRAVKRDKEKTYQTATKERSKTERAASKEKEMTDKEAEKAEKVTSKEKEKTDKAAAKEMDKAAKEKDKADRTSAKVVEKALKAEMKEQEQSEKEKRKAEKATSKEKEREIKEQEKAEKIAMKEASKAEKASAKDKEKMIKEEEKTKRAASKVTEKTEKEQEKAEKVATKEKERDATKAAKGKALGPSVTNITVTEKQGEKEKILVVEKGPTTRTDSRTRVGSIEVVTVSQFELLEAAVKELKEVAGPLPTPAFPDNRKLRDDIAKGTASLTDTMQAMQLTSRIQAAEQAIGCMADLITNLAASGAIPKELVDMVEEVKVGVEGTAVAAAALGVTGMGAHPSIAARKSVAIDPTKTRRPSTIATRASMASGHVSAVSHKEMDDALRSLREDLTKSMNTMTAKATAASDAAVNTAKSASDKSDIASKLNSRITTLNSLVSDYAEQLSGFDSGLMTQMQSFQEQMAQMRNDLKGGLTILEQASNNKESAAIMELNERYEGLVTELDRTLHLHQSLTSFQRELGDQLRSLVERVEMLHEQKADRDEVQDGLRDKADLSRLAGLLTEFDFAAARAELETRLELCHEKFKRQETVWLGALRDLTQITENKAQILQLMATRDDAQQQLREMHEKLHKLSDILGEPKAAMITRALSRDATCGACMIPALMEQTDISYGAPPALPAFRPRPIGASAEPEQPCLEDLRPTKPPDANAHICNRWVGGSHTLMSDAVTREHAAPMQLQLRPTKRFAGYGSDGRLYMMEEDLQPCVECNMIISETKNEEPLEVVQGVGDGDKACDCL